MRRRRFTKRHALLARWGGVSLVGAALLFVVIAAASRRTGQAVPAAGTSVTGVTSILSRADLGADAPIRFDDVTESMGLVFRHFPAVRASLLPEDMGSGVACGDYDGDGFTDLFLVNFAGSALPGASPDARAGRSRLFRNDRGQAFVDQTREAGIDHVGFGMGAAWGDYDNDGDLDLYVTAYGANVLYENRGDGTFREVTANTGTQDRRFSAGCAWADYDRDGDLDLYVCNYVDFTVSEQDRQAVQRQYDTETPYTLNPSAYEPLPNALFRNNGDGTFTECAAQVGVADPTGRSLSVTWVDLDNDGWPDLYVANDVSSNGVFRNRGDGTFEDIGASSLAADYRGAMGIAASDFDNDLDVDLVITHWIAQENALYLNMVTDSPEGSEQRLWFLDAADRFGLGQISLDMVGWATGFCDFDNDGHQDLWLLNGSTLEVPSGHRRLVAQPALLFWNRGPDGFVDVAARASAVLGEPMVGRGGAHLDFDRDGRVDLVLQIHGGLARVLKNVSTPTGHWVRIHLRQTGGNTAAIGARIYLTADDQIQMAEVGAGASYLSQSELTPTFGLGSATRVDVLRIVWPDGAEETHTELEVDRTYSFKHAARYPVRPN